MSLTKQTHVYVTGVIRSVVGKKQAFTPAYGDVLTMCFCVVGGLRCYLCASTEFSPSKCNDTIDCPMNMDRCFSMTTDVMGKCY